MRLAFAASLLLSTAIPAVLAGGPCGIFDNCKTVAANGLKFQCREIGSQSSATKVLLVHGFPMWSGFWSPLLKSWEQQDVQAVACDMRGYSPGASPDDVEAYNYITISTDIGALADSLGFAKFHLVGHDHGAGVGWIAASKLGDRVLSWTAMSVPHLDVFSSALYGKDADEAQQAASNYMRQWSLTNSSTAVEKLFSGLAGWKTADGLQKGLLWYNGMFASGIAAKVPVLDDATIAKYPVPMVQGIRALMPLPVDDGTPQKTTLGNLTVPTLFVCGKQDAYLLCSSPWVSKTSQYVADYKTLNVDCGHDLLTVSKDCTSQTVQSVMSGITEHIFGSSRPILM